LIETAKGLQAINVEDNSSVKIKSWMTLFLLLF
jgi:hypothetical protein